MPNVSQIKPFESEENLPLSVLFVHPRLKRYTSAAAAAAQPSSIPYDPALRYTNPLPK